MWMKIVLSRYPTPLYYTATAVVPLRGEDEAKNNRTRFTAGLILHFVSAACELVTCLCLFNPQMLSVADHRMDGWMCILFSHQLHLPNLRMFFGKSHSGLVEAQSLSLKVIFTLPREPLFS